jgi:hypothetical protein
MPEPELDVGKTIPRGVLGNGHRVWQDLSFPLSATHRFNVQHKLDRVETYWPSDTTVTLQSKLGDIGLHLNILGKFSMICDRHYKKGIPSNPIY